MACLYRIETPHKPRHGISISYIAPAVSFWTDNGDTKADNDQSPIQTEDSVGRFRNIARRRITSHSRGR